MLHFSSPHLLVNLLEWPPVLLQVVDLEVEETAEPGEPESHRNRCGRR